MVDSVLEVKQIKQLSADGGATVVDVENQTIDGVTIGGTTPAAGTFTTFTSTGDVDFNNNYVSGANLKNTGSSGSGIFINDTNSSNWHYTNSVNTGSATYTANTNITIVPENALDVGAYWGYIWFTQGPAWPGDRCVSAMCNFTILNTWGSTFHSFVALPTGSRLAGSGNIEIRAFGTVTNQKNGIHARCTSSVGSGTGYNVYCNIRLMRML